MSLVGRAHETGVRDGAARTSEISVLNRSPGMSRSKDNDTDPSPHRPLDADLPTPSDPPRRRSNTIETFLKGFERARRLDPPKQTRTTSGEDSAFFRTEATPVTPFATPPPEESVVVAPTPAPPIAEPLLEFPTPLESGDPAAKTIVLPDRARKRRQAIVLGATVACAAILSMAGVRALSSSERALSPAPSSMAAAPPRTPSSAPAPVQNVAAPAPSPSTPPIASEPSSITAPAAYAPPSAPRPRGATNHASTKASAPTAPAKPGETFSASDLMTTP